MVGVGSFRWFEGDQLRYPYLQSFIILNCERSLAIDFIE